jgi:peptidoglycan/xylan/chitin deacetylase (PgdA/CDA1 family)
VPFTLALATEATSRPRSRGTIPWATLRQMLESGLVSIASHGHTHSNSTALSESELGRELEHSRTLIEQELRVRPEAFVYPLGAHDERVRQATEAAGYRAAFAAQGGPVTSRTPRFAIPRYGVEHTTSLFEFAYYFRHARETR